MHCNRYYVNYCKYNYYCKLFITLKTCMQWFVELFLFTFHHYIYVMLSILPVPITGCSSVNVPNHLMKFLHCRSRTFGTRDTVSMDFQGRLVNGLGLLEIYSNEMTQVQYHISLQDYLTFTNSVSTSMHCLLYVIDACE